VLLAKARKGKGSDMKKMLIAVLVLSVFAFAQNPQTNILRNTLTISNMAYDSLKASDAFNVTDYENIRVIIKTATVDSSAFYWGYQRGGYDQDGNLRWQRPIWIIDTVNTLTGANFIATGTFVAASGDTDLHQSIDTNGTAAAKVYQSRNISPLWSPVARLVFKGLGTSYNKHTLYTIWATIEQRRYTRVDVGTGKQPN
jgi:hypothetical protein